MNKFFKITIFQFFFSVIALASSCPEQLVRIMSHPQAGELLVANNVLITGENYLYNHISMLKAMKINQRIIDDMAQNKEVLSLGEGYSGLVPWLRQNGINAWGLDLWYDSEATIRNINHPNVPLLLNYIRNHAAYLISADARNTRLPSNSFDYILSHMLINNLPAEDVRSVLLESIRLLKPGGSARFFGFENHVELVEEIISSEIHTIDQYTIRRGVTRVEYAGQTTGHSDYLLIFTKRQ